MTEASNEPNMTEARITKAEPSPPKPSQQPIIWLSGRAAEEYEFITPLSDATSLPTVKTMIKHRQAGLVATKNYYDRSVLVSFALGAVFATGACMVIYGSSMWEFGLYLCALSYFHLWEFIYVSIYHPTELTVDSFLINQSPEYCIAMGASFIEYILEWILFPSIKGNTTIILPGLLVVVFGLAIRTLAMFTAGSNFHHLVREQKQDGHVLITTGIYGLLRHPAYFGWFWYAVATQLMLANPLCLVLYCYFTWKFFAKRIVNEEAYLIKFFWENV